MVSYKGPKWKLYATKTVLEPRLWLDKTGPEASFSRVVFAICCLRFLLSHKGFKRQTRRICLFVDPLYALHTTCCSSSYTSSYPNRWMTTATTLYGSTTYRPTTTKHSHHLHYFFSLPLLDIEREIKENSGPPHALFISSNKHPRHGW